ncbi:MAG: 2-C-methyl-D-erythritol 2,4-cyclodiphosphate synthase [Armatimonadetes bacterium]|nr:2-C-methyl-D-erythritol 2,4-cyclodiphosphate synthase [Armatimonadota bacterium]MDI9583026.1 2-C-methyl-D-erythritol 2,4-cyclodiphosphate synthase [Acidobacteriota bacterium]
MKPVAALIVAAGTGSRFGGDLPKVFVDLCGLPLFAWSLRAFDASPLVDRLFLAVSTQYRDYARDLLASAGLTKPCDILAGGARRQDTVYGNLLAMECEPPEIIAIHDGARPLIDGHTIERSIELARERGACVTAAQVTDTIKQASASGEVVATPDRSELWRAQTPQTFRFPLLLECYRRAEAECWQVTDDASVVERCGHPVHINPCTDLNMKVTTPRDLTIAQTLLGGTPHATPPRVGTGYDVHALTEGRRLIIGGVEIPHEKGLAGHSDADVLIHAIVDAILGAAALGDIGKLFPDTDATYKNMDSAIFLREAGRRVGEMGLRIANIDATVIAQRPKLAPHIPAMRENIASALGVDVACVSVKATTTERLGFEGREEGIAAQAVVMVAAGR